MFHDFWDFLKHPVLQKLWEIYNSVIETRWVEGVFLKIDGEREFSLLKQRYYLVHIITKKTRFCTLNFLHNKREKNVREKKIEI